MLSSGPVQNWGNVYLHFWAEHCKTRTAGSLRKPRFSDKLVVHFTIGLGSVENCDTSSTSHWQCSSTFWYIRRCGIAVGRCTTQLIYVLIIALIYFSSFSGLITTSYRTFVHAHVWRLVVSCVHLRALTMAAFCWLLQSSISCLF